MKNWLKVYRKISFLLLNLKIQVSGTGSSYYPLFCMVEEMGLVLDVLHRSGNVHDSNGSLEFVKNCIVLIRKALPKCVIEIRMDSAFFSDEMIRFLEGSKVQYTISVPFERFTELKGIIEKRKFWRAYKQGNYKGGYFDKKWKPKKWGKCSRFVFVKKEVKKQNKKTVQLDLFEPIDWGFEFKVIVTNKKRFSRNIVRFHEGRGQQEHVFAELKNQAAMSYIPVKSGNGNRSYLVSSVLAHNLTRIMQIKNTEKDRGTNQQR